MAPLFRLLGVGKALTGYGGAECARNAWFVAQAAEAQRSREEANASRAAEQDTSARLSALTSGADAQATQVQSPVVWDSGG